MRKHFPDLFNTLITLVQFVTLDSVAAIYVPFIAKKPVVCTSLFVLLRVRNEFKSGLASPNFFLPDLVNFLKLRAHAKKELLVLSFFLSPSLFQIY